MVIPPLLGRQSLVCRNRMYHGKDEVGIKIPWHPYPLQQRAALFLTTKEVKKF
jgi:hypothetical protein